MLNIYRKKHFAWSAFLHYESIDDILNEVLSEMANDFLEYTKGYDHILNPKRNCKRLFFIY